MRKIRRKIKNKRFVLIRKEVDDFYQNDDTIGNNMCDNFSNAHRTKIIVLRAP